MTRALTVMQLLPALESGGVERSTLEMVQALTRAGHRAIVVSGGGRMLRQVEDAGARHIALPIGRKSLATFRYVLSLRRLFRDIRPDIVHARSRLPAWLGWMALRLLPRTSRPRFVTTVHGLNSVNRYSAIMARGEQVIAVSTTVRDHLLANYRIDAGRIEVIPRGIDPGQWPRGHRPDDAWQARFHDEFPMLSRRRLLVLPARGTRLKGHADAVDLLAGLVGQGEDVALVLVGADEPGRERYVEELRALAHRRGVGGRLAITAQRGDVRELMARADIVLQLSSRPESFGRTVIEALSLGRPVLGWNHGGVGELLGELYPAGAVERGDHAQLLDRALRLLAEPPIPGSTERYTLALMQARTLALYARLAAEPSA